MVRDVVDSPGGGGRGRTVIVMETSTTETAADGPLMGSRGEVEPDPHVDPPPPTVIPAVAVEDMKAGDAVELVLEPLTGRSTVRRRSAG